MNIPEPTKMKVRQLVSSGNKLEAVKFVREQFGLSLRDALKLVEALDSNEWPQARNFSKTLFPQSRQPNTDRVFAILSRVFLAVAVLLLAIGAAIA